MGVNKGMHACMRTCLLSQVHNLPPQDDSQKQCHIGDSK